jgi:cobalamin synthase
MIKTNNLQQEMAKFHTRSDNGENPFLIGPKTNAIVCNLIFFLMIYLLLFGVSFIAGYSYVSFVGLQIIIDKLLTEKLLGISGDYKVLLEYKESFV